MTTDFTITATGNAISLNNSTYPAPIRPPSGTTYNLPIISSQGMISTRISNSFIDWFGSSGGGINGAITIWHYSVSYQLN